MMYFQVEDLFKRFDSLTELEQNNWQQPQQTGSRTRRGRGKVNSQALPLCVNLDVRVYMYKLHL